MSEATMEAPVKSGPEFTLDERVVNGKLATLPISSIRIAPNSLRPVDETNPEFINLLESVKINGVIEPIQVRPFKDEETGEEIYYLTNGLQRMTAAKLCGHAEINVSIRDIDELRALEEQVITNAVRVETKAYEFSKHLKYLITLNPQLTVHQLAGRLSRSPNWVQERLGLSDMPEEVGRLLDEGRMALGNAKTISTLPAEVQPEYATQACTMEPTEFAALVKERRGAIRKAKTTVAKEEVFEPVPFCRKWVDLKEAIGDISLATKIVEENNATTPVEGFLTALLWVANKDAESLKTRQADFEQKLKDKAEKKRKAEEQRAERTVKRDEIKSESNKLRVRLLQEGKPSEAVEAEVAKFIEDQLAALKAGN